jgi:hypothetical protein
MYATISIGNSDNKLTQQEWSEFVEEIDFALRINGRVHFFGGPPTWMPWQSATWIVDVPPENFGLVMSHLVSSRTRFKQESVFVLVGSPNFI